MKKIVTRLLSLLLIVCMLSGLVSVQAADEFPNTWVNTGDQAADIIGVARTQIGYAEPSDNHSKYNEWYYGGDAELAWCSIFISWCANQADIENSVIDKTNYGSGICMDFNPFGGTIYEFGDVTPQPGDIICSVTVPDSDYCTHTALIADVDDEYIYTIEGNSHTNYVGYVKEQRYLLHDAEDGSAGYQTYVWASGKGRSISQYIHILYIIRPDYHKYTDTGVVQPTCDQLGYTNCVCSICGASGKHKYVEPTGHVYGAGVLTTPMTDTQDGVVTYTCKKCGGTKTTILPAGGSPFIDVYDCNQYYYEPVLWAARNGIVYGTSDFAFSPYVNCTRAQVVTFLYRAAGEPTVSEDNPFSDVSSDQYYYDAVRWGYQNGIVYGTSDTKFSPNALVTRAQFITFLYRFAREPEHSGEASPFTDVPDGEYYSDAVRWGYQNGIVYGTSNTKFSPNAKCSRAQVVTFLNRYLVE